MELPDLHRACYFKDTERLKELLGADEIKIDKRDRNGRTALHYGCLAGSQQVIEILLDRSPEMHLTKDRSGCSPVYLAIQHGHLDCVELLARRAHSFDERDQNGITPLHAAISSNQPEISEFLIKKVKANVDEGDNSQITPLHTAVSNGMNRIAKLLIEYGANINAQDCHGRTPLILAASGGEEECVANLIENGANLKIKDFNGSDAKDWASKKSLQSIYRRLATAVKDQDIDTGCTTGTSQNHSNPGYSLDDRGPELDESVRGNVFEAMNDVEHISDGYNVDGKQGTQGLLSPESDIEIEDSDGDGYSYLQSERLLPADQSEKVVPFEKKLPYVPGSKANGPQFNSQYQGETSDDNKKRQTVGTTRVHFADEPEIIDAYSEKGLPLQDQDLPSDSQNGCACMVPHQSVVGSTEKSRENEVNCMGSSSILYSDNIDIDEDQTLQGEELLPNIDQISSLTMIMSNDTNYNEAPESQDIFNLESAEYTMGIERVYRLSDQFLPDASSADGHQSACNSNTNIQYATKWEPAHTNEYGEYIVNSDINSKLNVNGVLHPMEKELSFVKEGCNSQIDAVNELKIKQTISNLEIYNAKVKHQIEAATVASEKILELNQQRVDEMEAKLEKERQLTQMKDAKVQVLRNIYSSMVNISGDDGSERKEDSISKRSEQSSIIAVNNKHSEDAGLFLESNKDTKQIKKSYKDMKEELEKKINELTFSNEYYEDKLMRLNDECMKQRKEIRMLQEQNKSMNQIRKIDDPIKQECNEIKMRSYVARTESEGSLVSSKVPQNEIRCLGLLAQTTDSLIIARQNSFKKFAKELKGKFLEKTSLLQDELDQVKNELRKEKDKNRRLSLHEELKDRFVVYCESLQEELAAVKDAHIIRENLKGSFWKEGTEIANSNCEEEFNFNDEEQKKVIGLLKECISENQQSQSNCKKFYTDAKFKEEMYDEIVGSNLLLEEALAKSYEKISYLEERLSTLQMDSNMNSMIFDVKAGINLQQSETIPNARKKGDHRCDSILSNDFQITKNDNDFTFISNKKGLNGVGVRSKEHLEIDENIMDQDTARQFNDSTYSEEELEMSKVSVKELLKVIKNLIAEKEQIAMEIDALNRERLIFKEIDEKKASDAEGPEQMNEDLRMEESEDSHELMEENKKLVRDLWKARQLLEKSENDNVILQEEYNALISKFEAVKAKADILAQNNDTVMSLEDVLEENATLMNKNAEITAKNKELLEKLNEKGSCTLNEGSIGTVLFSKESGEIIMSHEVDDAEFPVISRVQLIAKSQHDHHSLTDSGYDNTSCKSDSKVLASNKGKQPKTVGKRALQSPDIRLRDLIRALDSDTEEDFVDDQSETTENTRNGSSLISENGYQEGTLLVELNQLIQTNISLKDKVKFLEKWSGCLNEEILRLQSELKAVEIEHDSMKEQCHRKIDHCTKLQDEIKKLNKNIFDYQKSQQSLLPANDANEPFSPLNRANSELITWRENYELLQTKAVEWNNTLVEKIHRLQDILKEASTENCALKRENEQIKLMIYKYDGDIGKSQELRYSDDVLLLENESVESKLEEMEMEQQCTSCNLENDALTMQRIGAEFNPREEQVSKLARELSDAKDELVQAKYQFMELFAQKAENNELKEKLQLIGNINSKTITEKDELVMENTILNGAIVGMKETILSLRNRNNELESKLECIGDEPSGQKDSYQCFAESASFQLTSKMLDRENTELKQVIDGMKLRQQVNMNYILELEKECEILVQENSMGGAKDASVHNKLKELQKQCMALEEMLEENEILELALVEEQDKVAACLQEVKAQRLDLDRIRKEHRLLKKRHDALEKKNRVARKDLKAITELKKRQALYIFELENEIELTLKEVEELKCFKNNFEKGLFGSEAIAPSTTHPCGGGSTDIEVAGGEDCRRKLQEICELIKIRKSESVNCIDERVKNIPGCDYNERSNDEASSTTMENIKEVVNNLFDKNERMAAKINAMGEKLIEYQEAKEKIGGACEEMQLVLDELKQDSGNKSNIELEEIRALVRERLTDVNDALKERLVRASHSLCCSENMHSESNNRDIDEVAIKGTISAIFDENERLFAKLKTAEIALKEKNGILEKLDSLTAENDELKQIEGNVMAKENHSIISYVEAMNKKARQNEQIWEQLNALTTENMALKQNEIKLSVKEMECLTLQHEIAGIKQSCDTLKAECENVKGKFEESRSKAKTFGDILEEIHAHLNEKIANDDCFPSQKLRELANRETLTDIDEKKFNRVKEMTKVVLNEGERMMVEAKIMEQKVNDFEKLKEEFQCINLEYNQMKQAKNKLEVKAMESLQYEEEIMKECNMLKDNLKSVKERCNALEKFESELTEIRALVGQRLIDNEMNDYPRETASLDECDQLDVDCCDSNLKDLIEKAFNEVPSLNLRINSAENYKDDQITREVFNSSMEGNLHSEQIEDKQRVNEEEFANPKKELLDAGRNPEETEMRDKSLQQEMEENLTLNREVAETYSYVEMRLNENEELSNKIIKNEVGYFNLKEVFNVLFDENQRLVCKAHLTEEKLKEYQEVREKLDATNLEKVDSRKIEYDVSQNEKRCLKKTIAEVRKDYDEVMKELYKRTNKFKENEKLYGENSALAKDCKAYSVQNRILVNDNDILNGRNMQLKQMLRLASATMEKLVEGILQSENEVLDLKEQLDKFQSSEVEKENIMKEHERLKAELETYRNEMAKREHEVVTFTNDIKKMNDIIEKKDENFAQATAVYNEKIDWLRGEKNTFGIAINEKNKLIDAFRKQKAKLEEDLLSLQSRVEEVSMEKTEIKKCLEKEIKGKDELRAENEILINNFELSKNELVTCKERLISTEKELKKATDILKRLANERKTFNENKEDLTVQLKELQEERKKFQAEKAAFECENFNLKADYSQNNSYKEHRCIAQKQTQTTLADFGQSNTELKDLNTMHLQMNNELENVQRRLQHSEEENKMILEENDVMRLKIVLIVAKLENAKHEVEKVRANNYDLCSKIKCLERSLRISSDACLDHEKDLMAEEPMDPLIHNRVLKDNATQRRTAQVVSHDNMLQQRRDSLPQVDRIRRHNFEIERETYEKKMSFNRQQNNWKENEPPSHSLEVKAEHLSEAIGNLRDSNTKLNRLYSDCLRENEALNKFASLLENELTANEEQHDDLCIKYRDARNELKRLEWNQTQDNALQSEGQLSSFPESNLAESTQRSKAAPTKSYDTLGTEHAKACQSATQSGLQIRMRNKHCS